METTNFKFDGPWPRKLTDEEINMVTEDCSKYIENKVRIFFAERQAKGIL